MNNMSNYYSRPLEARITYENGFKKVLRVEYGFKPTEKMKMVLLFKNSNCLCTYYKNEDGSFRKENH